VERAKHPLPEPVVPSRRPNETPQALSQCRSSHQEKLSFLEEKDWDPQKTYDDRFHYLIEWKLRLNRKAVTTQSEPNVAVSLGCYWRLVLRNRLRQAVCRQFSDSQRVRHNDTTVAVSVTERSERYLTMEFDGTEIDWVVADKRLLDWSPYFQKGKRLRVNISFNFVEPNSESASRSARRGDKRGSTSASSRMLAERDRQLETEREVTGRQPIWKDVYAFMRCPKTSCDSAPHCWIDSDGKHYRMNAKHLQTLVEHVAQHRMLETHNDVPRDLQEKLITEDRDRRTKQAPKFGPSLPPINIVLPDHPQQSSQYVSEQGLVTSGHPSDAAKPMGLEISGFLDDALRDYAAWQQSRVRDPVRKAEIGKALDVLLQHNFDLGLIFEDQNPDFLVQAGVLLGTARRFCCREDILNFNGMNKRPRLDLEDRDHEDRN
jgi:hypothetical protein